MDRTDILYCPQEVNASSDVVGEPVSTGLHPGALPPVTGHDQVRRRELQGHVLEYVQGQHRPLDRCEATDDPDGNVVRVKAELVTQAAPTSLGQLQKPLEADPRRHDLDLPAPHDAEANQVRARGVGDREDPVGLAGQPGLDPLEQPGQWRGEVPLEDVPVERVHPAGRGDRPARGPPAQRARLGGVGMDDVRLEGGELPAEANPGPEVAARDQRREPAPQARDLDHLHTEPFELKLEAALSRPR